MLSLALTRKPVTSTNRKDFITSTNWLRSEKICSRFSLKHISNASTAARIRHLRKSKKYIHCRCLSPELLFSLVTLQVPYLSVLTSHKGSQDISSLATFGSVQNVKCAVEDPIARRPILGKGLLHSKWSFSPCSFQLRRIHTQC